MLGDVYFISSSRVNLGLHQRDVSVVWDLGPHDFSILLHWLGRAPEPSARSVATSIVKGVVDVAFVDAALPVGHRRPRRAELAVAEQAAPDRRSSAARRWSSTRTARPSRSACSTTASSTTDPETFGAVPAVLPHRRHRLAQARRAASRSASSCEDFRRAVRAGDAMPLATRRSPATSSRIDRSRVEARSRQAAAEVRVERPRRHSPASGSARTRARRGRRGRRSGMGSAPGRVAAPAGSTLADAELLRAGPARRSVARARATAVATRRSRRALAAADLIADRDRARSPRRPPRPRGATCAGSSLALPGLDARCFNAYGSTTRHQAVQPRRDATTAPGVLHAVLVGSLAVLGCTPRRCPVPRPTLGEAARLRLRRHGR